jgi:hypothetical protein
MSHATAIGPQHRNRLALIYLRQSTPGQAQADLLHLFRRVDVAVEWQGCVPGTADPTAEPSSSPFAVTVVLLPAVMADRLDPRDDMMGKAPGTATARGRPAYVFYDRLQYIARFFSADVGQVLGNAIAHEVGHLLLPHPSHSTTGLMRAIWVSKDFQDLAHGRFLFTAEHGAVIRARLERESDIAQRATER